MNLRLILWIVAAVMFAPIALAQAEAPPIAIPFVAQIVGVIVAVFALVSAIIPDSKMPKIVGQIVNFLALNFGQARNSPPE